MNLEDYKKDFGNLLSQSPELIQVEKYSSKKYNDYQQKKDFYEKFNINKYKHEYFHEYFRIFLNDSLETFIYDKLKEQFKLDFGEEKFDIINKENKIDFFLEYWKENIKESIAYKKSNAEKFFPFLKKLIENSYNNLNKTFLKLFYFF